MSRPALVTAPDGEQLASSYGANWLLAGLTSSLGPNFVSGVEYNALNQPTTWTLGSDPLTTTVLQTYNGVDGVPVASVLLSNNLLYGGLQLANPFAVGNFAHSLIEQDYIGTQSLRTAPTEVTYNWAIGCFSISSMT
jgi:hypothetical protein